MTSFPIPHNYGDHILVASPSNVVRQRVLESLRSPVRRFEQATGGAEALVHLESGFWQVLFLDRRLPDLDAEELSQTVRQRFPGIEVVLLDPESDAEPAAAGEKENLPPEMWPALSQVKDQDEDENKSRDKHEDKLLPSARPAHSILEDPLPGMISNSRIMQPVYRLARLLAPRWDAADPPPDLTDARQWMAGYAEIARLKLASMDVQIDLLTSAQEEYLSSWTHGT